MWLLDCPALLNSGHDLSGATHKKEKAMEKQLFDWNGWDQHDTAAFAFYNVVLKVAIGEYPAGAKFKYAFVNYETGTLQLYPAGASTPVEFQLLLTIKEK